MENVGRVLIIEDLPIWQKILVGALEGKDYYVRVVADLASALERIRHEYFHLAVIDLRLIDEDPTDYSGMKLLKEIAALGLNDVIAKIIVTAYGTEDLAREAFKVYNAHDFIPKRADFNEDEFLGIVKEAFAERVKVNFDLVLTATGGITFDSLVEWMTFNGERIKEKEKKAELRKELIDLFQKLFYEANQLVIAPLSSGISGTGIVRVDPFYAGKQGKSVVVKFGGYKEIREEAEKFDTHVRRFVRAGRNANKEAFTRTLHLGGIVYSLIGTTLDGIRDFNAYYAEESEESISNVLENLFGQTCRLWYENRSGRVLRDMGALYMEHLRLSQETLERALVDKAPHYLGKHVIKFPNLDKAFPNPVYWIKGRKLYCPIYVSVTHGDLNGKNILIDPIGQTWLIDFYRTGEGHILWDFIELETVIKFELLETEDIVALYEFEKALLAPMRLGEAMQFPSSLSTNELMKAFTVIKKLRELAHDVIRPSDDVRDYYIGLLYMTLNMLRFYRRPKARRQHALLSAAMLCEKLEELGI